MSDFLLIGRKFQFGWRHIVTIICFSLAFFIPNFSADPKINFVLTNLCDYNDILIAPFFFTGLYLHSHDISTLSWIYSLYPRFWDDLVKSSFPLFLCHWPIMLMVSYATDTLALDKPMSVIFICTVCVLGSSFVDNYIVLAFEDYFVDIIKPSISKLKYLFTPKCSGIWIFRWSSS